jgi:hypothetical protein
VSREGNWSKLVKRPGGGAYRVWVVLECALPL